MRVWLTRRTFSTACRIGSRSQSPRSRAVRGLAAVEPRRSGRTSKIERSPAPVMRMGAADRQPRRTPAGPVRNAATPYGTWPHVHVGEHARRRVERQQRDDAEGREEQEQVAVEAGERQPVRVPELPDSTPVVARNDRPMAVKTHANEARGRRQTCELSRLLAIGYWLPNSRLVACHNSPDGPDCQQPVASTTLKRAAGMLRACKACWRVASVWTRGAGSAQRALCSRRAQRLGGREP